MKLGLLVESEEGLTWPRWRAIVRAAERLGFESVWLSDHFRSPWDDQRHGLEPWVALAVAAAETRRIRLGTLVSPVTFRPPVLLARMAEAIDALSAGRLVVGLGLGWNAAEHVASGLPFPGAAERAHMLEQQIKAIREAAPGARVLVGGSGARTLRIAARCADEWNMTTASSADFVARAQALDRACADAGREPRAIKRSIAAGVLIGRDAAMLHERAERMRACVPPLADADDVTEAARGMGWLAGTPNEIVAAVQRLARAGVDLTILGHYDQEHADTLELLAAEVMPAL